MPTPTNVIDIRDRMTEEDRHNAVFRRYARFRRWLHAEEKKREHQLATQEARSATEEEECT